MLSYMTKDIPRFPKEKQMKLAFLASEVFNSQRTSVKKIMTYPVVLNKTIDWLLSKEDIQPVYVTYMKNIVINLYDSSKSEVCSFLFTIGK